VPVVFEQTLDQTGTIGRKPGSGKRHTTRIAENIDLVKEMALSPELQGKC